MQTFQNIPECFRKIRPSSPRENGYCMTPNDLAILQPALFDCDQHYLFTADLPATDTAGYYDRPRLATTVFNGLGLTPLGGICSCRITTAFVWLRPSSSTRTSLVWLQLTLQLTDKLTTELQPTTD